MSQTFGEMIREKRLARGLSLGQLASAVSTAAATVRLWERGEGVPSDDQFSILAQYLELDAADIADVVVDDALAPEPVDDLDESPTELMSAAAGVSLTSVAQPEALGDDTVEAPMLPFDDEESDPTPEPVVPEPVAPEPVSEPEAAAPIEPPVSWAPDPEPEPPSDGPRPVPLRYPESAPVGVAVEIAEPEANPWNPLRYLYDPEKPWLYWIRAGLTVIVLLILLNILFDSVGELFDKIGEVFDSIEPTEPVGGEEPIP